MKKSVTEIHLGERRHPSLFLNKAEIEQIRTLIADGTTYQHRYWGEMQTRAERWLKDPLAIPERGGDGSLVYWCPDDGRMLTYDPASPHDHVCPKCGKNHQGDKLDGTWRAFTHLSIAFTVRELGILYAVEGDSRYATAAAQILLRYADTYAGYPVFNLAKVTRETLDEVNWVISLAAGYDLIYHSGALSREQKQHVEEDLFQVAARFIQVGHGARWPHRVGGGRANFQLFKDSAILAIGLLLRDVPLVEFAINGPVGFNAILDRGVAEDGLWWEGSPIYHFGVIMDGFQCIAELAWHVDIDLYSNDKLRRMYEVPLKMRFGDETFPALHDCPFGWKPTGDAHFYNNVGKAFELYYTRTGNPGVLPWLTAGELAPIRNFLDSRNQVYLTEYLDPYTLWVTPTWPASVPIEPTSVNLEGWGLANLRADHAASDIHLLMDYGPHGNGHGHFDKLNLILYANGRIQAPDLGIVDYRLPQAEGWYRQTVSHNTVVIDETSQRPSTGQLHFFLVSPRAKIVDASPTTDQEETQGSVVMRRTLALLDDSFIVDIFTIGRGGVHVHDWVYHNFGAFHTELDLVPQQQPLGEDNGYDYITNVRRARLSDDTWSGTWTDDGQGVQLTMVGTEGMEVIAADGLGATIDDRLPMVVVRNESEQTIFKTVITPFRGHPAVHNVRELPVVRAETDALGTRVGAEAEGVCLEIESDTGRHYFLLGYTWGLKRFGDIGFDGQIAYVSYPPEDDVPGYLFMVNGCCLKLGEFALRADRPVTMYLQRVDEHEYVIENQGDLSAEIQVSGIDWRDVRVSKLDGAGRSRIGVGATVEEGALTLTIAPGAKYHIQRQPHPY